MEPRNEYMLHSHLRVKVNNCHAHSHFRVKVNNCYAHSHFRVKVNNCHAHSHLRVKVNNYHAHSHLRVKVNNYHAHSHLRSKKHYHAHSHLRVKVNNYHASASLTIKNHASFPLPELRPMHNSTLLISSPAPQLGKYNTLETVYKLDSKDKSETVESVSYQYIEECLKNQIPFLIQKVKTFGDSLF